MSDTPRRFLPSTAALSAFDAVARHGSFTDAAQELALTQGAISRQIAALETQLDVSLFERTTRGVALTAAGTEYAAPIAEALATIRDASIALVTNKHDLSLTLAIPPTFGTRWLMPRLPRFVAAYPDVTLSFITRIGRVELAREGIDAAIHIGESDWPDAHFTLLRREVVTAVACPSFITDHALTEPPDLLRVPLLHLGNRPTAWRHWFDSIGLTPPTQPGLTFEQFAMVAQAASAGIGVALLPRFLIEHELSDGQLMPVVPHTVVSTSAYYLAVRQHGPPRPPVRWFSDWLLSEISRDDDDYGGLPG